MSGCGVLTLLVGGLLVILGVFLVQARRHRQRWQLLSQGTRDVLWFWDGRGRFRASKRIWDWVDCPPGGITELYAQRERFLATSDLERIREVCDQLRSGTATGFDLEFALRFPDRDARWVRVQGQGTGKGRWLRVAGSLTDVSEVRQLDQELWRRSHLDDVTGLPNRRHLLAYLSAQSSFHTLLLIDIDHFSAVNEAYRHSGGDRVLRWFADVLRLLFRGDDLVSRSGGDEFVVVVKGDLALAQRLVTRIQDRLKEPFPAIPVPWILTVSVAVVPWTPGGAEAEEVLSRVERALHRSQAQGGGRSLVFDSLIAAEADRRAQLEVDLPLAVRNGDLRLVFQPQYRLVDRRLTGFEALARWTHPGLGEISPAEFIPLAETLGLISDLGTWALASACHFLAAQPPDSIGDLTVSVNVSALQLRDPGFFDLVERVLRDAGVSPSNLELELTESVLVHSSEEVFRRLATLRNRGIRIALDDFGKGYSSLSYLRLMPLDTLKIDQEFLVDPAQDALLGGIVHLGRLLNLEVVAEGVEEEAQLAQLESHGCHRVQGFLLSRPLERAQAEALIAQIPPWPSRGRTGG